MKKQHMISYIFIFCLLASPVMAETTNSLDLTTVGIGVRAISMGSAYTAIANDSAAIFTNPAGLADQKQWAFTTMSAKLMDRIDYKLLGGIYPFQYGTIGVGYVAASTPGGYLTTDKASITSAPAISYGSNMLLLSFGKNMNEAMRMSPNTGKLYLGATLKALANTFSGAEGSGQGTSCDFGLIFKPNDNLKTGVTLKNTVSSLTWKSGTGEKLQQTLNLGVSYAWEKVLASGDMEINSLSTFYHAGLEYRLAAPLSLRVGFDQSPNSDLAVVNNYTAGLGINYNGFSFDYAYRQDNSLPNNSASYFSISFQNQKDNAEVVQIEKKSPFGKDELAGGLYKISTTPKRQIKATQSDLSKLKEGKRDILKYYDE